MKNFKLSTAGLMVLAAGAFIVVLACIGMTQYGQASEKDGLEKELALSTTRLNNLGIEPLEQQLASLQAELERSQGQLADTMAMLNQTVISEEVTDKFYVIAADCGVTIENISTTKNQEVTYENVACDVITVNVMVTGDLSHIIGFVTALNDSFVTGFVKSSQISIDDPAATDGASSSIVMIVYSCEGS